MAFPIYTRWVSCRDLITHSFFSVISVFSVAN